MTGGGHVWQGACVAGGHAWQGEWVPRRPPTPQILRDTVNERTVRILLECILVKNNNSCPCVKINEGMKIF